MCACVCVCMCARASVIMTVKIVNKNDNKYFVSEQSCDACSVYDANERCGRRACSEITYAERRVTTVGVSPFRAGPRR